MLIKQLQEQHYRQYMHQIYQHQLLQQQKVNADGPQQENSQSPQTVVRIGLMSF